MTLLSLKYECRLYGQSDKSVIYKLLLSLSFNDFCSDINMP